MYSLAMKTSIALLISLFVGLQAFDISYFEDPQRAGISCNELFAIGMNKDNWLLSAQDIAVFSDDSFLISDKLAFQVKHFDPKGKLTNEFGTKGSGSGEFRGPCEISTYKDLFAVADFSSPRIQIFTKEFKFLKTFNAPGPIFDLSFDQNGTLWIGALTHVKGQSLFQYDIATGEQLKTIELKNSTGDGFYDQFWFAIDKEGAMAIAYVFLNKIEIWNTAGEYLNEFSVPGVIAQPPTEKISRGFFSKSIVLPKGNIFGGISLDSKGNLIILSADYCDHAQRDVYVLTYNGRLVTQFTLQTASSRITIDSRDRLFSIDKGGNVVRVSKLKWK
jgi:hypothetical protein